MSLADVVQQHYETAQSLCHIGKLEQELDGRELDSLLLILYGEEREWGKGRGEAESLVYALLTKAGKSIPQQIVNRHRAHPVRRCACAR